MPGPFRLRPNMTKGPGDEVAYKHDRCMDIIHAWTTCIDDECKMVRRFSSHRTGTTGEFEHSKQGLLCLEFAIHAMKTQRRNMKNLLTQLLMQSINMLAIQE